MVHSRLFVVTLYYAVVCVCVVLCCQGVHTPEVGYTSCRICHLIGDFEFGEDDTFKVVLVER